VDSQEKKQLRYALIIASLYVVVIWAVKAYEYFMGTSFADFGIYPRSFKNFPGIITAPLIHGDWEHLWSNTMPLFVTVASIYYLYKEIAFRTVVFIWAMTGIWVWIGAVGAFHIGASGLIYGFVSFLFFSGVLRWERRPIALSILVAFLYGGMVWGIFPTQPKVSWESHLFGAISGVLIAVIYRKKGIQRTKYRWEDEPDIETPYDQEAYWNYKAHMPPPPVLPEDEETIRT
jgi:membrane associated rhomboid family serine protease